MAFDNAFPYYETLFWHGVGPVETFLLFLTAACALNTGDVWGALRRFSRASPDEVLTVTWLLLLTVGAVVNTPRFGLALRDIAELAKYAYYIVLFNYVRSGIIRWGVGYFLRCYLCGLVLVGVTALAAAGRGNIVVLPNPNVTGNLMAIGAYMAVLLMTFGRPLSGATFAIVLGVLATLTFSKGAWLMTAVASGAFIVAVWGYRHESRKSSLRVVVVMITIMTLTVVGLSREHLREVITLKVYHTQQDSSVEKRWGFVLASVDIALDYPFFGVGISNFERAYDRRAAVVGRYYLSSDNPHSAFLYLLACGGIPTLFVFLLLIMWQMVKLWRALPVQRLSRAAIVLAGGILLAISGAVQLQLVTQKFFWILIGVAAATYDTSQQAMKRASERAGR